MKRKVSDEEQERFNKGVWIAIIVIHVFMFGYGCSQEQQSVERGDPEPIHTRLDEL